MSGGRFQRWPILRYCWWLFLWRAAVDFLAAAENGGREAVSALADLALFLSRRLWIFDD